MNILTPPHHLPTNSPSSYADLKLAPTVSKCLAHICRQPLSFKLTNKKSVAVSQTTCSCWYHSLLPRVIHACLVYCTYYRCVYLVCYGYAYV